ncbi:MAG: ABC transporter ATP-binding protein [Chitinophagales bacterium]
MKLEADQLCIGYSADKIIYPDISFTAQAGDMIALLGVNGVGKSTLLRTISGLQQPVSGTVSIGGKRLPELTVQQRALYLSIVLTERMYIEHLSVREFISLGRAPYTNWLGRLTDVDEAEIEHIIQAMKIEKLSTRLFNQLSDGEKQKTAIARALCQQTPVIILDEPTAFLDFRNKRDILELLAEISIEMNKVVILSTHDIEASLEYCSKWWLMPEQKNFTQVSKVEDYRAVIADTLYR